MDTNKTWASSLNNYLTSFDDQVSQYQEICYYLKVSMLAAGWTVALSTDGTNAPDATDQWTSAGILLNSTAAARAWIVMRSPLNWVTPSGAYIYILIGLNDASTTVPRAITLRYSSSSYSGGSTTAYPSSSNGATHSITNIVPYATPRRSLWCSFYTADGDVIYAVKTVGQGYFSSAIVLHGDGGFDDNGVGDLRALIGFCAATEADALIWSIFGAANTWRGFSSNGGALSSNWIITQPLGSATFQVGRLPNGSIADTPIDVVNSNSTVPRYLGQWLDVRGAPAVTATQVAFNEVQRDDTDPFRLVLIGGIWVPVEAAQLPIQ